MARSYNGRKIYTDKIDLSTTEGGSTVVGNWIEDESLGIWFSRTNSSTLENANFQTKNGEKFVYVSGTNAAGDGSNRGGRLTNIPVNQGTSGPFYVAPSISNVISYGVPVQPVKTYKLKFDVYFENPVVNSSINGRRILYRIIPWNTRSSTSLVVSPNLFIPDGTAENQVHTIETEFTTPVGAEYLSFEFEAVERGAGNLLSEAWFRNISIEEVIPARSVATNRVQAENRVAVADRGTALRFDGVDDYVEVPDADIPASAFQNGFTLSAWINPFNPTSSVQGKIIDKSEGTAGQNGFSFFYRGDSNQQRIRFTINNISIGESAPLSISARNWSQVVVTVAPNGLFTFYINAVVSGTPQTTGALSSIVTNNSLRIGNRSNATDRRFDGIIDEPRIWSRALTAQEVSDLYKHDKVPQDGLVGEWLFNEGTGTTAYDTSGNGNDGTISGAKYTTDVYQIAREEA